MNAAQMGRHSPDVRRCKEQVGTIRRYIEAPAETSEVVDWFRRLQHPPKETWFERGCNLHFQELGPLRLDSGGRIDVKASPLASVIVPRIRRASLWTVGEVHFLPSPLRARFPDLHKICTEFTAWIGARECVFSPRRDRPQFSYYLEGSIRNYDSEVFAFESGHVALSEGRYFVADEDTEFRLDRICKALRLRGVECSDA